jgi:hypothetical protein
LVGYVVAADEALNPSERLDRIKQRLRAELLASRVQKTLQRDVPLRAMFECSTVAELAGYIEGLAANEISAEKLDRLSDLMAELEGF